MKSCVWLVSLVLLFTSVALAQRDLGTITGTVTDPSGAVVPGATVTISEASTGQNYKLQTTGTGDFTRPALPPGTYTVTAEARGFRRVSQENVLVTAGSRVGVPLTLAVGQLTESVVVTGEAPLLQSESTQLGAGLSASAVSSMPLGGQRVFTYLARLSPGVNPSESGRDGATGGFSANGIRGTGQNNYLLNGVDNNVNVIDFLNGASFVIGPPPEAIGEMQIMTSGENAEYGRGAGGVVNVNLKSGTNELHGGVWEILQNDKLNANEWQRNRLRQARPIWKQNQFGGAAGGPIIKNKLFVFGDYQGTRIRKPGSNGLATLPTKAEDGGDFSGLLGGPVGVDANGSSILQYQIFDPTSTRTVNGQLVRDPFTGNKIPSGMQDPAAAKILALFPTPNQPVNGFPQNDFAYSGPGIHGQDSGDLRGDFRLTEKDSIYGSLSWMDNYDTGEDVTAVGIGLLHPNTTGNWTRNGQLGYTRVWTPSIVSESRAATTRLKVSIVGTNQDRDDIKNFGIGGYDPINGLPQNGGLMAINPSRYAGFGAGGWQPMIMYSNVRDFIQNVAVMKGSHAVKFGAELRLVQFPFAQFSDPHGTMNFSTNATAYPAAGSIASNTGDGIASFLLGAVDSGVISTTNFISSQKQTWSFYAQDDWKVSRKLTLNLGMRYEIFSPTYERFGRQSNFVWSDMTLYIPKGNNQDQALAPTFASNYPNVKVSRGQVNKYMMPWDKWDFGPRFGLAYNMLPKTVLRLGFGIFYGGEENVGGNPNLGQNAPFNFTVNVPNPATFGTNPTFAGGFHSGFPSSVLSAPVGGMNFHGLGTDLRSPLVQKWNVAVQRQLPWGTALEVAYIGNHQSHQYEEDQGGGNPCPNLGTTNTSINCETLRLIPYIGVGVITNTNAYANYNALTLKFEKRLSGGVQFISSYAYAHVKTDACLPLANTCPSPDPLDYSTMYFNAQWDHRHSFTTGFTYELPVGKGKARGANMSSALNQVVGGWGLNGILTIRTGAPSDLNYNGCQGVWRWCRPDIASGDPNAAPSGGRTAAKWFNTSALKVPAALTGGNAPGYNIFSPGNSTLDAALFKNFPITERVGLEFRMEAFNVFNKTQLGGPDTNFQNATFGSITSSGGARNAQFSLRLHF